jgi:predicted GIY-YIG superfamily endonuclease
MSFHYIYILVSESDETCHYTGMTQELQVRLQSHNAGQVPHTSKSDPGESKTPLPFVSGKKQPLSKGI